MEQKFLVSWSELLPTWQNDSWMFQVQINVAYIWHNMKDIVLDNCADGSSFYNLNNSFSSLLLCQKIH